MKKPVIDQEELIIAGIEASMARYFAEREFVQEIEDAIAEANELGWLTEDQVWGRFYK